MRACTLDSECPGFYRCNSGQCTEATCASNRECVAALGNVEATCTNKKCTVPCQTDLECGSSRDYQFYSCIASQCVYTGCESDKECELYYDRSSFGGSGTSGSAGSPPSAKPNKIVCRDATTTP